MIRTQNQPIVPSTSEAGIASYWLGMSLLLLLLLAGRATSRTVADHAPKPASATVTRPTSNLAAAERPQLISTFVSQ